MEVGPIQWMVVPVLVLAFCTPSDGAADARPADRGAPGATLKASVQQAEEGDRVTLTARIKSPATARRATLLRREVSVFGDASWKPAKSVKVRGQSKVAFGIVAAGPNADRYRVSVTYAGQRAAVTSKPISLIVWSWIALADYRAYYSTSGVGNYQVEINGQQYAGWGALSRSGSWEARFTPGRKCKAFSGVLGLHDTSDDGSSGRIGFTADDTRIYDSPSLTPGMDMRVEVPLATPYRFGIQLLDTSPEGLNGRPVIGDPALLCTGVSGQ